MTCEKHDKTPYPAPESEIRVGDEFDVRVRVRELSADRTLCYTNAVSHPQDGSSFWAATLRAATRVQRELRVGDRTRVPEGGTVIAIHGDEVWMLTRYGCLTYSRPQIERA